MKIYNYHSGKVRSLQVKDDPENENFYITIDGKASTLAFHCLKRFRKNAWPDTEKKAIIERICYYKAVNEDIEKQKIPHLKKIAALRKILTGKEVIE